MDVPACSSKMKVILPAKRYSKAVFIWPFHSFLLWCYFASLQLYLFTWWWTWSANHYAGSAINASFWKQLSYKRAAASSSNSTVEISSAPSCCGCSTSQEQLSSLCSFLQSDSHPFFVLKYKDLFHDLLTLSLLMDSLHIIMINSFLPISASSILRIWLSFIHIL